MGASTSTQTPVAEQVCFPLSEVMTQAVSGVVLILLYILCFAIGV